MADNKNKTDNKTTEKSVDKKSSSENITQENVVENNIELILGEKGYEYYINNKKKVTFYSRHKGGGCCKHQSKPKMQHLLTIPRRKLKQTLFQEHFLQE